MLLSLTVATVLATAPAQDCKKQVATLKTWLAAAKKDGDRGAFVTGGVATLFSTPLAKPSVSPKHPAAELRVSKAGIREGRRGPVAPVQARAFLQGNSNLQWARSNRNAIARGVLVAAEADAPAASVRAAVDAALQEGEEVWLVFKPADAEVKAAGASATMKELDKAGEDIRAVVTVVQREFGKCGDLMDMMRKLGGMTAASRFRTFTETPPAALEACQCRPSVPTTQAILWHLAFKDLGVVVPVPKAKFGSLDWGKPTSEWSEVAARIIADLNS